MSEPAHRQHYGLTLAVLAVAALSYALLQTMVAPALPDIQRELHISPAAWGWVLSAYVLAYSLFEIPSGAMGDRRGYRRELSRITIWWSFFTLATAFFHSRPNARWPGSLIAGEKLILPSVGLLLEWQGRQ